MNEERIVPKTVGSYQIILPDKDNNYNLPHDELYKGRIVLSNKSCMFGDTVYYRPSDATMVKIPKDINLYGVENDGYIHLVLYYHIVLTVPSKKVEENKMSEFSFTGLRFWYEL